MKGSQHNLQNPRSHIDFETKFKKSKGLMVARLGEWEVGGICLMVKWFYFGTMEIF